MTSAEINTLVELFELERTQILTVLSFGHRNHLMAGLLLTENNSNFVDIESARFWFCECQHHLLPPYTP